jgi:hypothetical protein
MLTTSKNFVEYAYQQGRQQAGLEKKAGLLSRVLRRGEKGVAGGEKAVGGIPGGIRGAAEMAERAQGAARRAATHGAEATEGWLGAKSRSLGEKTTFNDEINRLREAGNAWWSNPAAAVAAPAAVGAGVGAVADGREGALTGALAGAGAGLGARAGTKGIFNRLREMRGVRSTLGEGAGRLGQATALKRFRGVRNLGLGAGTALGTAGGVGGYHAGQAMRPEEEPWYAGGMGLQHLPEYLPESVPGRGRTSQMVNYALPTVSQYAAQYAAPQVQGNY